MAGFKVEVDATSLKKLEFAIEAEKKRLLEESAAAIKEVAEAAVENAKRNAPVASGALRDGISAIIAPDGQSAEVGPHDPKTWYAIIVEWGSSERPAHPFMAPAAETARTDLRKALIEHANHATEEAGA